MSNSTKLRMLIADDERHTKEALVKYFRGEFEVDSAEDGLAAIDLIEHNNYDLVLTDLRMSGADGMGVLAAALKRNPPPGCILFTAYGSVESAVAAVKAGAFDFVTKPVNLDKLEIVIRRALESRALKAENARLKQQIKNDDSLDNIVAKSPAMREVMAMVRQVAPSKSTVLLTGESGSGKEVIANAIHTLSRRNGNFVPVHCAALPANLLESELFGYEKGAFTGAAEQKIGRFELAQNGTLFLDEIGEIDPQIQVKLLRVLENRSFERLGGVESVHSTARLISATNRNLEQMVRNGEFREDLLFRLNVINIELPPLRERLEDIPILIKNFIDYFAAENERGQMGITEEAVAVLCSYAWPGNIRELRNCVERMIVLSRNEVLDVNNIPVNIRGEQLAPPIGSGVPESPELNIGQNEKYLIERSLAECGNNRTRAAEKLGISRRTLHRRLLEYGIK